MKKNKLLNFKQDSIEQNKIKTKVEGSFSSEIFKTNNNEKNELLVYLYNAVEDEWSFINSLSDPVKKAQEIEQCKNSSDCYFLGFAANANFVFVSPVAISEEFQNYAKFLMKYKEGEIIVPKTKSHLLCDDFINDRELMENFIEKAKNYKKIILISYSATPQFYNLKNYLIQKGLNVFTPGAPEIASAWTVNFFGSKSGIRQLAQKSAALEPDFMMPDGVICLGKFDAAKIAAHKFLKQKGVVIKTNKGSSGSGLFIFRENDLPSTYEECERKIQEYLSQENYWENFPIIVEDLINVNYSASGGFPNIEFKIHKNGRIEMLYYCAMLVTPKGKYYGMHMNDEIFNERLVARFIDTGYFIAEQFNLAGYRGHFDIDMIAGKNGHVYVTETNTRYTGGTDIYQIVQKLIGKDFMANCYLISEEKKFNNLQLNTFKQILIILQPFLYSHEKKEGLIINSENSLKDGSLIYTLISSDKKKTLALKQKMENLLLQALSKKNNKNSAALTTNH